MSELYKITNALDLQVSLINEVITRYINDEVGQSQQEKFNIMTREDKINLLSNTLTDCSSYEDFETKLIINFDYNNY